MNKYTLGLAVAAICLGGCSTTSQVEPSYSGNSYVDVSAEPASTSNSDEVDLIPPVPSFLSVEDCDQAYADAAGGCASAAAVYTSVGLTPPPGASTWFIPFAFGAMTNVLLQNYFAVPAPYIFGVLYDPFTTLAVINNYKQITRRTIDAYYRAPLSVQAQVRKAGLARYSTTRKTVVGATRLATTPTSRSSSPLSQYTSDAAPSRATTKVTSAHSTSFSSAQRSPSRGAALTNAALEYNAPVHAARSTYVSPPRQTVTAPKSRSCVPKSANKCS
jgi:hypothetical protein